MDYNYKVVAEIKNGLSEEEKAFIIDKINELMEKTGVENIGNNTYCKRLPVSEYNDFGPVCFFSIELEKYKAYFSKLEYYDLVEGERDIAV